jgi:hypothetical protein
MEALSLLLVSILVICLLFYLFISSKHFRKTHKQVTRQSTIVPGTNFSPKAILK